MFDVFIVEFWHEIGGETYSRPVSSVYRSRESALKAFRTIVAEVTGRMEPYTLTSETEDTAVLIATDVITVKLRGFNFST